MAVGRITKLFGAEGEVNVNLYADFPDNFTEDQPLFTIAICSQHLHGLDMVAVVMPPATNRAVHIVHFPIVGLDQLPLVGSDPLVYLF